MHLRLHRRSRCDAESRVGRGGVNAAGSPDFRRKQEVARFSRRPELHEEGSSGTRRRTSRASSEGVGWPTHEAGSFRTSRERGREGFHGGKTVRHAADATKAMHCDAPADPGAGAVVPCLWDGKDSLEDLRVPRRGGLETAARQSKARRPEGRTITLKARELPPPALQYRRRAASAAGPSR